MSSKKAIQVIGMDSKDSRLVSKLPLESRMSVEGIACDKRVEPIPYYNSAPCEKVIAGENNTFIVLGRDRPSSRVSGYGGRGDTQCGSIDIVVGRMGFGPKQDVYVDPDFFSDAARIHISQRSDIDKNFKLVNGRVGESIAKSSIGFKADALRFVAREGIKIVSGFGDTNSYGGLKKAQFGVDIIANNNDSELEPMVKGNKLIGALETLKMQIEKLSGTLNMFVIAQMAFNQVLASHTHISSPTGGPTSPSVEVATAGIASLTKSNLVIKDLYANRVNFLTFKYDFLSPVGKNYVNSRFNNVN